MHEAFLPGYCYKHTLPWNSSNGEHSVMPSLEDVWDIKSGC